MDLDNIKKSWQEAQVRLTIDEDKIQKMLDNKGKGAFSALLKFDRLGFWLLIPCLLLGIIGIFCIHLLPGIFYSILVIGGLFWQRYKIQYLKGFDLSEMGILEVSKCITKYKKFIIYEILIGAIAIVVFFIFYTYFGLPEMFPKLNEIEDSGKFLLIMLITGIIATAIFSYLLYRYMYLNNIKRIEKSIKEIEEFEYDNN